MFYSFSLISFIIISQHFFIPILNANQSVEDNMLITFMKSPKETKISEYSMRKCEAHFGIMYFMRVNWQCDQIADEFEEYERTECQKYRKYLDILYEYLCKEYAGIPTMKPKFVFKGEIEIEGPIIYSVNCLVKISRFYFNKWEGQYYEYKLNNLFIKPDENTFKPKLLNEKRLNYEIKFENEQMMPINEMILQLAIDTTNNYKTNKSLEGIIRQNFGDYLEEMLKKAEERAEEEQEDDHDEINDDKHLIIAYSKFEDQHTWYKDALFSEFVKGLATNFEKFFKLAKEYSNFFYRLKVKEFIFSFELDEIEKTKKHMTQAYEAHLGLLYLMRENWLCEQIGKKFEKNERTKCQKYRKFVDILYEYLFRLYAEAKNPKVSKQLPPLVKPIFIIQQYPRSLINVFNSLNDFSKFHENPADEIKLVNEEELNIEIKEEKNWSHKKMQNEKQISNGPTDIERIREEFEQKLEKMYENAKENAKEEKKKLKKAIKNATNSEAKEQLSEEYENKFGIFISSPFHNKFLLSHQIHWSFC